MVCTTPCSSGPISSGKNRGQRVFDFLNGQCEDAEKDDTKCQYASIPIPSMHIYLHGWYHLVDYGKCR